MPAARCTSTRRRRQAGGRCRSYFDAATNLTIDNGNHLLLSGNHHALAYARAIGTEAGLVGPERAQFPFVDLSTGQRWQLDLGDGRLPTWVFDEARRVPDTGVFDYLKLAPLIWAGADKLVGDTIPCEGTLYQRLVQPLLLAALNCRSAGRLGRTCRRDRAGNAAGGRTGLPAADRARWSERVLVEPAVKLLQGRGASVRLAMSCARLQDVGGSRQRTRISARTRSRSDPTMPSSSRCRRGLPPR